MTGCGTVLNQLRAHAARPLDAHEAAMTADAIRFVTEHPDCLLRSCTPGHLTGSAWMVNPDRTRTLLAHHRKLGKWLQLGGHADGESDLLAVALREAREESGLTGLNPLSTSPFDVDRHWIPARKGEPGHWHFDLRFAVEADPAHPLTVTRESRNLAWVEIGRVAEFNAEESVMRMVRKTPTL
jgi:8-oxo-dGTP pyrophosphatase MutT (NUDIX family)